MLACPECGDAATIRIERDGTAADGDGVRWRLRCGSCGAAWTMTDRA